MVLASRSISCARKSILRPTAPGERSAGMVHVEMQHMSLGFDLVDEASVAGEAITCRDVVIDDENLGGAFSELQELFAHRCDIDERDQGVVAFAGADAVIMPPGDVVRLFAPSAADGPGRSEAVGASRMVETELFHDR